jgi:hypothetical protein
MKTTACHLNLDLAAMSNGFSTAQHYDSTVKEYLVACYYLLAVAISMYEI